MSARHLEVAARVAMAMAYIAVCGVLLVVMVPPLREWARYRAQVMDYHLALIRWQLGSKPPPEWTEQLRREDLPSEGGVPPKPASGGEEEVKRDPDGPSGGL